MADYMERRRVLSILHEIGGCGAEPGTWADGYDKAINEAYDRISREPTADIAPVVHGRWMPFHSEAAGDIQYCSACEIGFDAKTDYCPHCGAKMDGGADNG